MAAPDTPDAPGAADKPPSMVARAFTIIDAIGPEDQGLSMGELARRTGIPKPTVHRLVVELESLGVLRRTDRGAVLAARLFELGLRVRAQQALRDIALPFMEDLFVATHATVHLAVLADAEILIVEKINGHDMAPTPSKVGGRGPVHCTALGKALLAHSGTAQRRKVIERGLHPMTPYTNVDPRRLVDELELTRARGYATELEESSLGIACAAAPIFDHGRRVVGAVSIATSKHRYGPEALAMPVRTAAAAITRQLAR